MTQKWREFERFVARVEALLTPKGAIVKSPDKLPDVVTGQLREVDASIRYTLGTAPVLLTIECRDRKYVEDQTWIEQLATKKENVGASLTIAVSSTGLSGTAAELARRKGIETRTMNELPDEVIQNWISGMHIGIYAAKWRLVGLWCVYYDSVEENVAESSSHCLSGTEAAEIPIFNTASSGPCCANAIIDAVTSSIGFEQSGFDVPHDGQIHRRGSKVTLPIGSLSLIHGDRFLPIKKLTFEIDVKMDLVGETRQGRFAEYKNGATSLFYAADFSTRIKGKEGIECTVSFQKDAVTLETTYGVSLLNENSGEIWTTGKTPVPRTPAKLDAPDC